MVARFVAAAVWVLAFFGAPPAAEADPWFQTIRVVADDWASIFGEYVDAVLPRGAMASPLRPPPTEPQASEHRSVVVVFGPAGDPKAVQAFLDNQASDRRRETFGPAGDAKALAAFREVQVARAKRGHEIFGPAGDRRAIALYEAFREGFHVKRWALGPAGDVHAIRNFRTERRRRSIVLARSQCTNRSRDAAFDTDDSFKDGGLLGDDPRERSIGLLRYPDRDGGAWCRVDLRQKVKLIRELGDVREATPDEKQFVCIGFELPTHRRVYGFVLASQFDRDYLPRVLSGIGDWLEPIWGRRSENAETRGDRRSWLSRLPPCR